MTITSHPTLVRRTKDNASFGIEKKKTYSIKTFISYQYIKLYRITFLAIPLTIAVASFLDCYMINIKI